MAMFVRTAVLLIATFVLAACGGGGGSATPPPPPPVVTPPPSGGSGSVQQAPIAPVDHVSFVEIAAAAGLDFVHGFNELNDPARVAGGVAVGDYNGDGWLDVYLVQGDTGQNRLFENRSQGGSYNFVDVTALAGVGGADSDKASGPAFVDHDGDGDLDLFVGSVANTPLRVFENQGDGTFDDVTASTGLAAIARENSIGMAFGDFDADADLDLFVAHWTFTDGELPSGSTQHLWQNNADGSFTDVSDATMVSDTVIEKDGDYTFSPTFADVDNDGLADLLVVADNHTSQVLINSGDLGGGLYTFNLATDEGVVTDEAGMGSSVADFDNDGDLDWFVSSISLGDSDGRPTKANNAGFNLTGNRYYRNEGNGQFSDQTDLADVRKGYWGWASCAADFNNDGWLDLFHVNGMDDPQTDAYLEDPSRLFINNGDGTFTEYSEPLGLTDTKSGRGVTCFDGDRDGDIDILVANNHDSPSLIRNDGGNQLGFLSVRLAAASPNTRAVGARLYVTVDGVTQMRELHNGSNYVSQNPMEQHFGLGESASAQSVEVVWPDGTSSSRSDVTANQRIAIDYPDAWSID